MKKLNIAVLIAFTLLIFASIVFYIFMGLYAVESRVLFFAALIAAVIYAALNFKTLKVFFKKSGTLKSINNTFQIIVVTGILVFVYLFSGMAPLKIDLTASRLYSLSEETAGVLNRLTNDINVYFFKSPDKSDPGLDYEGNLLKAYAEKSGHLKLLEVDPNQRRSLADQYNVTENGAVVFDYKGSSEKISVKNIVKGDPETGRLNYLGEPAFTLAIKSLLAGRASNIYILQGHGEINPADKGDSGYSSIAGRMSAQNLRVKALDLLKFPEIPGDCGLLIIGNPTHPFSADVMDKIDNFVNRGGSVLVLLKLETDITINDILRQMGLYYYQNLAVEDQDYVPQYGKTVILPQLIPNEITMPLIGSKLSIVMPESCGILELPEKYRVSKDELALTPLLKTSPQSFGEVSLQKIKSGEAFRGKEDIQGPLVLGYLAKKVRYEGKNRVESRMIVFGGSDFINNTYIDTAGNSDMFLNSVNYLLKRDEEITIRPKSTEISSFQLTSSEQRLMEVVSAAVFLVYILPGIIIVLGRRRRVKP
jgi:hypothetical protein